MKYWLTCAALLATAGTTRVAFADLPEGITYDDGYAYFKVESHGSVSNNRPTHEYTFHANARLLGTGIAQGSAFKFVIKQGRRTLHSFVCEGRPATRPRQHRDNPPDMFVVDNCTDRDTRLNVDGDLTVEVWFIDDATDEEHLAHTHTVDVRRLRQENHQGIERPADFVVNQHGWTPVALIDQTPARHQPMYSQDRPGDNSVSVVFHWSPVGSMGPLSLRCSVNGERVQFPVPIVPRTRVRTRASDASEIHRAGNSTEGDHVNFYADMFHLPITFGESSHAPRLEDHPGRWECLIRDMQRRTVREFAFTVADGAIQPHPEEVAGGLHFPEGVHMLDVSIPADSPADARTDPATARAGAFYGHPWASEEGRAMAQRVPQIGEAFPQSARRRGRSRRRRRSRR